MQRIHIHAGTDGDHFRTAVDLLWQGKVPTADLVGEVFTLDGLDEALRLLDRRIDGRDAIRVGLRLTDSPVVPKPSGRSGGPSAALVHPHGDLSAPTMTNAMTHGSFVRLYQP